MKTHVVYVIMCIEREPIEKKIRIKCCNYGNYVLVLSVEVLITGKRSV